MKKKQPILVWVAAIYLVIITGFRSGVGADYPIYEGMYSVYFPIQVDYETIFYKVLFQKSGLEIEWLFVLLNKLVFEIGMPFEIFTTIVIIISLSLKFSTIYKNVAYPILGILFYFMPGYFFEDSGQIRQGLGMAVCVFSFTYIKKRNLTMFLLMMFLAMGFHKSSVVFLPAYWLVLIPLTSRSIFTLIVISILLSPLEIYNFFTGFLDFIAPQDISAGFTGYIDIAGAESSKIGLNDLIKIFFSILLIVYDKPACEKIPYYEYMRNIGVFGVCLYFIMRGNPVFSTRLGGIYMFILAVFCIPNILYSVTKLNSKKGLHLLLVSYLISFYFVFCTFQAKAGSFTGDKYHNVLFLNK